MEGLCREKSNMKMSGVKRDTLGDAVAQWQDRWDSEEKGRDLYKFFPSIQGRRRSIGEFYKQSYFAAAHWAWPF